MSRRSRNGLTRNQNRLLMAIAGGVTLHADPHRPQLLIVPAKDQTFRTQLIVLRSLIQDDLVMVIGDDMTDVEATQKGLRALDCMGGYPRRKLPAVLHPATKVKVMEKIQELRKLGFEDPVDGLLAIAYETNDEGEFVNDLPTRVDCLKAAAPFCRPKLQAILAKSDSGQGHAEWLKELKGYVEQEENADDDHQGPAIEGTAVNGEDPGEPPDEPDGGIEGEVEPDQRGPVRNPQSR